MALRSRAPGEGSGVCGMVVAGVDQAAGEPGGEWFMGIVEKPGPKSDTRAELALLSPRILQDRGVYASQSFVPMAFRIFPPGLGNIQRWQLSLHDRSRGANHGRFLCRWAALGKVKPPRFFFLPHAPRRAGRAHRGVDGLGRNKPRETPVTERSPPVDKSLGRSQPPIEIRASVRIARPFDPLVPMVQNL